MKTLASFAVIAGCAMLFSACQSSDGPDMVIPEPETKSMEIRISPSLVDSRATDYGFETGDCIGLYVVNYSGSTPGTLSDAGNHVDNMRFRYNGSWIPDTPIYWADNKTHADFYLYHPYTNIQSVNAQPFAVKSDQSTEAAYKSSDLMIGKTTNVAPSEDATVVRVNHVMSRIMITLEAGNGFTAESLAAASVSVRINGVKCNSTVNLSTGVATPVGEPSTVNPLFVDDSYKALIVPQKVEKGNLISVTVDGREYNLQKEFTFVAAKSHKFTVILSKTSNGVNVTINPWGDDGTDNGGTSE